MTWYKKREKKDMFEELKEMICEYVDVEPGEIREDSRFVEDLGFNSYDFMSMVDVKTVKDAMEYIQSLQQAV